MSKFGKERPLYGAKGSWAGVAKALAGSAALTSAGMVSKRSSRNNGVRRKNMKVRSKNRGVRLRNQKRREGRVNKKRKNGQFASGSNKRQKTSQWVGAGRELLMRKYRLGGKPRGLGTRRLVKISVGRQISRFQNIGPIDRLNDQGAMLLGNMYTTDASITPDMKGDAYWYVNNPSTTTDANTAPFIRSSVHLYCLNQSSLIEDGSVSPNQSLNGPAYQLFLNTTDSTPVFTSLAGCSADLAAPVHGWQPEWQNTVLPDALQYVRQCWYDIRLSLRNASQQTTYFDIWVCSFKHAYLDPLEVATNVEELRDRKAFWTGIVAAGSCHPITSKGLAPTLRQLYMKKAMRVIMSKENAQDVDVSPEIRHVKLFVRDGKMYKYQYASAPDNVVRNVFVSNAWQPQGPANVVATQFPRPRARTWLIVRSYDPTTTGSANADDNNAYSAITVSAGGIAKVPSYDVCIRKCEQFPI